MLPVATKVGVVIAEGTAVGLATAMGLALGTAESRALGLALVDPPHPARTVPATIAANTTIAPARSCTRVPVLRILAVIPKLSCCAMPVAHPLLD
jgi:hypothetical protein